MELEVTQANEVIHRLDLQTLPHIFCIPAAANLEGYGKIKISADDVMQVQTGNHLVPVARSSTKQSLTAISLMCVPICTSDPPLADMTLSVVNRLSTIRSTHGPRTT